MLFGLTFCISSNISSSQFLAVTLYQVELQDGVDNKEVSSAYIVIVYTLKCSKSPLTKLGFQKR